MPWKTFKTTEDGKTRWCVHKLNADDSKGERVACHATEAEAEAQMRALYRNVKEFHGNFTDILVVSELRGDFPADIPHFADIDLAELTKGDPDPMFLTIPIGKANVVSGNKRFYDEAWLQELERQVKEHRPIGIMGHLKEDEMGTAFPPEAIFWVGVRRIGELLWGKGYIPVGAARDRIRRYKATNKTIATSIFAGAAGVWDKVRGATHMLAETLKLQQIDIGPADRIGIPDLAHVPILTAEMQVIEHEENHMPDKLEIIQELKREDARLLPDEVRAAIVETIPIPPEVAVVQELRTTLGVDDKADPYGTGLLKLVRELREAKAVHDKAAVLTRITELAADPDKGIKVEPVRAMVVEMVRSRNPQTAQEAETAYTEIAASAPVTELLKAYVSTTMGPPQRHSVASQPVTNRYFKIPEEA